MTRLLAWVAIATLTVYLVFIGGGWAGIYLPELRVLSVSLAGAGLAVWALVAWRRPEWRAHSRLVPAIAAALGSLAVSTVFSRYQRVSLEYLGYAIVLAALYLLLVRLLAEPFFRRRLVSLMALLFVAVVGAYAIAVVAHWIEWWGLLGRVALPPLRPRFEGLTYLNPSAVLTMAALLAVPAAAVLPWSRRGLAGGIAILVAVGVVALLTGSRAGWLALALTIAAAALVTLRLPAGRARLRDAIGRLRSSRRLQAGTAALAAVTLLAAIVVAPAILRRVADTGQVTRVQYVVAAARLFVQSPIVGTGPGSWAIERIRQTTRDEPDFYIPHAHNLEAQTLAEQGLIGAAAAMVVALSIARLLRDAMESTELGRRRWAWASAAGLTYFVFHQLLDFYANMPAVLFAAAFPVAYLDATYASEGRSREPDSTVVRRALDALAGQVSRLKPKGVRPLSAFLTAVAVLGLLIQEVPALASAQAVGLANRGDWAAADIPAMRAANQDPAIAPYLFTAGLAAAQRGNHVRAATLFEPVARRDALPEALLNLAAEQAALGDNAAAEQSLRGALRLGRQRAAIGMAGGDLAMRLGGSAGWATEPLPKLMVDAFAGALGASPLLALDPWWQTTTDRQEALNRAISAMDPAAIRDIRWIIRLAVGDVAGAYEVAAESEDAEFIRLLVQSLETARVGSPDATSAASGDTTATAAYAACLSEPQNVGRLVWCARLADWLGDASEEARFRELAEFLNPGISPLATVPRILDPAGVAAAGGTPTAIGDVAYFWGTFTYRRFTPQDMLVPGLLRLVAD